MKPEIIDIAPKYKTDKNDHGYIEYYAEHLPETAKKILEIGVLTGNSIRMWRELYPEAHIYAMDLFIENPIPFQDDSVTWIQGSQTDGKLLGHVRAHGPYDFIIEDGSHNSRDQLITFYGLVDCSPLYIVEDLHCCNEEFYRQGIKFENTMLSMLIKKKYNEFVDFEGKIFPFRNNLYDDKIAFIYP